jgi:RNA polymerase sigma-70 factor (ECF subfamily)
VEELEETELRGEVCRCILDLLPTLEPGYADLLRRVDLGGEPVVAAAQALGITANNAGVRLHRARKALLREVQRSCRTCATHGCLDCSCGAPSAGGACGV